MKQRFEDAIKRVQENNLADLIFNKKYSKDENLQKAFLDGYAIGVLSSLLINNSELEVSCFEGNTELLQKALNGDKEAINLLEYLTNNKK